MQDPWALNEGLSQQTELDRARLVVIQCRNLMYYPSYFVMYNETSMIPRYVGLIGKLLREYAVEVQVACTEGQTSTIPRLFNE